MPTASSQKLAPPPPLQQQPLKVRVKCHRHRGRNQPPGRALRCIDAADSRALLQRSTAMVAELQGTSWWPQRCRVGAAAATAGPPTPTPPATSHPRAAPSPRSPPRKPW